MIRFLWYLLLALTAMAVVRCAHPVTPIGGPKDLTPPQVVESTPKNGSSGFNTMKFSLDFDEYISLENIQQTALISPPMNEIPDFNIKGKSLQVKFNEELKPKTTYSVYFGDAIVDITEKNPLLNYTYVFSTGDYVDSLSLIGNVFNAFDLAPMESVYVMLFKDANDTIPLDSLPYYVVPYYLSKTDIKGKFQFTGLSNDKYLIFALNDKNSNYIFDQPGEEIAFLDSLIQPVYINKPADTTQVDSISDIESSSNSTTSITDTLVSDTGNFNNGSVNLNMFLSPVAKQQLLKAEVVEKNKIRFSFSLQSTNIEIESLKYSPDSTWYIPSYSAEKDTLYWYLHDPPIDSLELLLTQFDDTLGIVYLKLDTKKKLNRSRKNDKKKEKEKLNWTSNIVSSKLDLNKKVEILFTQPLVKFNNIDSSLLVIGNDSIWDPEFNFTDSLSMKITFPFEPEESTKYRIFFPDSSFTNWNDIHSEPINLKFSTLALKDYGVLVFNLFPEIKQDYILQLLNNDEKVIQEFYFNDDTIATFSYLLPSEYHFKLIFDDNGNKKWDTGNYGLKIQPEKILYYPKTIKVRANWEIKEDWNF